MLDPNPLDSSPLALFGQSLLPKVKNVKQKQTDFKMVQK